MTLSTSHRQALETTDLHRRVGWVCGMQGLVVESVGPDGAVGELCRILVRTSSKAGPWHTVGVLAEVVGLKPGRVTLMPYGSLEGVAIGCEVQALGVQAQIGVGPALLGRVIDGFGQPMDGQLPPVSRERRPLKAAPVNPMLRPPIRQVFETGIRSIDGLLTLGQGQRIGIFAGSGVGKSTLLGMLIRHVKARQQADDTNDGDGSDDEAAQSRAPVNVIALIGERGREVRELIEKQLGADGLARSVVVVSTAEQPAVARLRAAYAALTIAEYFREQGRHVLLTFDSITRFAMARREVGLSVGEPPTARGYTPSVFAELPELCERCGTAPGGGAITALFTVLVEGDDLNEPVSDALRAILDGHIVLSRQLAHQGHYPAIDVLRSVSRLMPELADANERALALSTVENLAVLDRNRQMVDIGAYEKGANAALDRALAIEPALQAWLRQASGGTSRAEALSTLRDLLGRVAP